MKRRIAIIIAGILLMMSVFAQSQLYADINVNVKDNGQVSINGNTNYNAFNGVTTNDLTSKKGDNWLLNLSGPVFAEYIYRITLPQNSVVNYIKANTPIRIEESSGSIGLIGTGSNKPLNVVVQYSIGSGQSLFSMYYLLYGIFTVAAVYALYFFVLKNKKTIKPKKEIKRELYTERQLMILDYLQKHGTVTQAQLEKDLKLPKSSLSRNIDTLVRKEVIFKESKGMSNVIGFK